VVSPLASDTLTGEMIIFYCGRGRGRGGECECDSTRISFLHIHTSFRVLVALSFLFYIARQKKRQCFNVTYCTTYEKIFLFVRVFCVKKHDHQRNGINGQKVIQTDISFYISYNLS